MKKGVRHTTSEIMAFIRRAEEVGITVACKEYDICYTTGRRWIANHSLPTLQEKTEEDLIMIPTIAEEEAKEDAPALLEEPVPTTEEPNADNPESDESEIYNEYGSLILENERLKMRIRQLTRALTAIVTEE